MEEREIRSRLRELPWIRFIPDMVRDRWVDALLKVPAHERSWYLWRLNGIGGSEMAAAINAWRIWCGEQHLIPSFMTTEELWRVKYLLTAPDKGTPIMQRGRLLEPFIKSFALQYYSDFTPIHLEPRPPAPWWLGSPDAIWKNRRTNQIWIIDFKAPTTPARRCLPQYEVQLHHYYMRYRQWNPNMALIEYDYEAHDLIMTPVPLREELLEEMYYAGEWVYNRLVEGAPWIFEYELKDDKAPQQEELDEETADLERRYAELLKKRAEIEKELKTTRDALIKKEAWRKKLQHLTVQWGCIIKDESTVQKIAEPLGIKPRAVKLDNKSLLDLAIQSGLDIRSCYKSSYSAEDLLPIMDQLKNAVQMIPRFYRLQNGREDDADTCLDTL